MTNLYSARDSLDYKLGVIGLGHWFNRLNIGIQKVGGLSLTKAVGTRSYDAKASLLDSFGISSENYYLSDKRGHIEDKFYENIDVVHVSDPNKFHAFQTRESLSHGKYTIVEKSLGATKREFNKTISFIKKNGYEDRIYLHLHYIHKQPTLILKDLLPGLIKKHGKIKTAYATFFEKENEEDARRGWLFAPENGGLFMDWIHPFEILYHSTAAKFGSIKALSLYAVNPSYDAANPTGVEAAISMAGRCYANGAQAIIRISKGVKNEYDHKSIRILFESGDYVNLSYVGAGIEFESEERGKLEICKSNDVCVSMKLSGPNPSEIFVEEILGLCKGENLGLSIKEIKKIFAPQWEYQELAKQRELIKDDHRIQEFLIQGVHKSEI